MDSELNKEFLAHFGIKGMKWGQRRAEKKAGKKYQKAASSQKHWIDTHNAVAARMNNGGIKAFNNQAKYKNLDFTKDSAARRQYYDDYEKLVSKMMAEESEKILPRPAVAHSDEDEVVVTFRTMMDETGVIVSIEIDSPEELEHADFLEHYGVKGMKWGVHRDKLTAPARAFYKKAQANPAAMAPKALQVVGDLKGTKVRSKEQLKEYTKVAPEHARVLELRRKQRVAGVQTMTNKDLQEVIQRMNLEMQYKNLKKAEFEDSYLGAGGKFVGGILRDVTVDAASSWLKRPGSNVSGRTTRRVASSLGSSFSGQRAIGS